MRTSGPLSHQSPSVAVVGDETPDLRGLEKRVLAFEREWANVAMTSLSGAPVAAWQTGGAKLAAVREQFGLSEIRYLQVLNRVIDSPAALAEDPMTVRRLQRLREKYQRAGRGRRRAV